MLRNSPAQSALSPFNVRGIMATGVIRQGDYRYENLVFFSGIAAVILAYVFVGFARSYYLAGLFKARLPSSRVERWILRNQKPDRERWRPRTAGSATARDESGSSSGESAGGGDCGQIGRSTTRGAGPAFPASTGAVPQGFQSLDGVPSESGPL